MLRPIAPRPFRTAFCPIPPLLLDGLAGRRTPVALAEVAAACSAAVSWLCADRDPVTVLVPGSGSWPGGTVGSSRGYGVDRTVVLGRRGRPAASAPVPTLPLGVLVAARLLADADVETEALGVPDDVGPEELSALAASVGSRCVLVLGDSAVGGPESYGDAVAAALAAGRPDELAALDPRLGVEARAAGREVWRAAAALWAHDPPTGSALDCRSAPYGVDYLVARWWA